MTATASRRGAVREDVVTGSVLSIAGWKYRDDWRTWTRFSKKDSQLEMRAL